MEIKDKKLVSVLVAIIVILLIAVGALYFSAPQGGPQGNPPTGMRGGAGQNTDIINSTNASKNNTDNVTDTDTATGSTVTD